MKCDISGTLQSLRDACFEWIVDVYISMNTVSSEAINKTTLIELTR